MGLLDNKGWQAQEYYNEYLQLKESLLNLTDSRKLDFYKRHNMNEVVENIEVQIEDQSERFKFVLEQLELSGVSMKDLILLSAGLDT